MRPDPDTPLCALVEAAVLPLRKRITQLEAKLCESNKTIDSLTGHLGRETDDAIDLRTKLEKAEALIAGMVKKAADKSLDGYRELGARAAAAENERDALRADNAKLLAALPEVARLLQFIQSGVNIDLATGAYGPEEMAGKAFAALTPTVSDNPTPD